MRFTRLALPLVVLLAAACTTTSSDGGVDVSGGNEIAETHLRQQVDEMRYMHDQELLQRMYSLARRGNDASPAVVEGTRSDDWLVRMSCVWILGAIGDRRNIPAVHTCLSDKVPEVRYEAAATLVKLGDGRGFPVLVDGLSDGDLRNRFKSFQVLRTATGKDFGYRHDAPPDERRQATVLWRDWLATLGPSAL
jgi:hypothetical protein